MLSQPDSMRGKRVVHSCVAHSGARERFERRGVAAVAE
jgi:hypothetical protein